MRNWISSLAAASIIGLAAPSAANAASISVSPINVEVFAPGSVSQVSLSNSGEEPVSMQIRIFKWIQKNGKDELVQTRDVVASPPAIKILPGKKSVIRVVRVAKTPIAGEETYRLLAAEVPQPSKTGQRTVAITLQHSIPVFFTGSKGQQDLTWNARIIKGKLLLEAANEGTRRARVTNLSVGTPSGNSINIADGLAGYVLGNSRKWWVARPRDLKPGNQITITAQTEQGSVNATASVKGQ